MQYLIPILSRKFQFYFSSLFPPFLYDNHFHYFGVILPLFLLGSINKYAFICVCVHIDLYLLPPFLYKSYHSQHNGGYPQARISIYAFRESCLTCSARVHEDASGEANPSVERVPRAPLSVCASYRILLQEASRNLRVKVSHSLLFLTCQNIYGYKWHMDNFATFYDKNFQTEAKLENTINNVDLTWFHRTCFTEGNLFLLKL